MPNLYRIRIADVSKVLSALWNTGAIVYPQFSGKNQPLQRFIGLEELHSCFNLTLFTEHRPMKMALFFPDSGITLRIRKLDATEPSDAVPVIREVPDGDGLVKLVFYYLNDDTISVFAECKGAQLEEFILISEKRNDVMFRNSEKVSMILNQFRSRD